MEHVLDAARSVERGGLQHRDAGAAHCLADTDDDEEEPALVATADWGYLRMRGEDVLIHVSLATGDAEATVWGCDLSDTYVRFNADYTT